MIESITPLTSTTQQLGYQSTSNSDIEMGRKKISVTEPKGNGMTKWWMLLCIDIAIFAIHRLLRLSLFPVNVFCYLYT